MKLALLMVVSPGEESLAVDSLRRAVAATPERWHDPVVFLLNNTDSDLSCIDLAGSARVVPINIPAAPRPYFEIARTVGAGLAAIADHPDSFDLICKLDPDTVVVSPGFFTDIADALPGDEPAFVGWFVRYRPAVHWRLRLRLLCDLLPIGLRRANGRSRYGGRVKLRIGPAWHWRATLRGAVSPRQPSGGGYALSPLLLRRLSDHGWLVPSGPNGLEWNDDTLLPVATRAVGGRVIDLRDNPGLRAGWRWMHGSRYFTPEQALEPGLRALHPLKDNPDDQAIRRALPAPATRT